MSDEELEELQWSCRFFGHKLRTSRQHAGRRTKCPRCREWLWIPLHGLTVDELIERLTKDPEAATRAGAAGELSRLGLKAKRAVGHLIKAGQKDRSALVRFRSLDAVARIVDGEKWPGQIPARIITEIIDAVKSNHGDARNDIEEFGSDPATAIRQKAQHALTRIGAAAEQSVAEAIRQCSDDRQVHDLLAEALKTIREHRE